MKKIATWMLVFILLFSSVLFQGCASYKPLMKKDFASLAPLTVVYYADPDDIKVSSTGGMIATAATGVVTLCSLPILIPVIATKSYQKSLQKEIASAIRPSFNELVMKKFVGRVSKEIPNWPVMTVEEKPVNRNYIKNFKSGNLMIFSCWGHLWTGGHGFESEARATINDSGGNLLWKKGVKYNSKNYGRKSTFKDYKADNFKLLGEEIEFAAEIIVSDFIEALLKLPNT